MNDVLQKELKWLGSPVTSYSGTINEILAHIPEFERRPFALPTHQDSINENAFMDMIVRKPISERDPTEIPIGVVSKSYQLVQHRQVIDTIVNAVTKVGIEPDQVKAELLMTQYGERVGLHIQFPDEYTIDPGDGNPLALRLGCFNSVDGSTRFRAVLGWLRFVCSNGMVVGSAQNDYKRRHNQTLVIDDVNALLTQGIKLAVADKTNLERWSKTELQKEKLTSWIDDQVAGKWGVKAATRAFHIATTGRDAEIKPFAKKALPSEKEVEMGNQVPGSSNPVKNLYDVSQVLTWLAGQRNDVEEQLNWQRDVPELMAALVDE
ncbi:MAG: DUF932 domain-containing protein [Methylococcaceae bacterium]